MRKNTTYSGPLLLLLARPADSLCSIIQSWAIAHRWGDLIMCHSIYDIGTRLDDLAPQQTVILIARPAMLNTPFLASVLEKRSALRLVGWVNPDQASSEHLAMIAPRVSMIMVSDTGQLANVISALQTTLECKPVNAHQNNEAAEDTRIDPKNYRLSDDEIDALLGAE